MIMHSGMCIRDVRGVHTCDAHTRPSPCKHRNAYRDTFVNEFADDLEAVRQHAVASESGVVPLDELVRLISSGTNVFSPSQRHALYSTC